MDSVDLTRIETTRPDSDSASPHSTRLDEAPRARYQGFARVALGAAFIALGVYTLEGYLPAFAWATIFAIALWPLYHRVCGQRPPGRHNILFPLLFTLAVALVFLVPLATTAIFAGREAHGVLEYVRRAHASGVPVPDFVASLPVVGERAASLWQENLGSPENSAALLQRVDHGQAMLLGRNFGAALLHRAVLFGFTLLILFFLFRDGVSVRQQVLTAGHRAFGPSGERVGMQVAASVRGTVNGLVLVGLGEGAVMGVAYFVAGVPHPLLLGVLTAIAAMVPFGGFLAIALACLLLLGSGGAIAAIALFVFGMAVNFAADHAIRPVLVGGSTRLPFIWVLLGILGGIETWGLLGLFLGPAIMAALILLWREWTGTDQRPASP